MATPVVTTGSSVEPKPKKTKAKETSKPEKVEKVPEETKSPKDSVKLKLSKLERKDGADAIRVALIDHVRSLLLSCLGSSKVTFENFLFSAKDEELNKAKRSQISGWTKEFSKQI